MQRSIFGSLLESTCVLYFAPVLGGPVRLRVGQELRGCMLYVLCTPAPVSPTAGARLCLLLFHPLLCPRQPLLAPASVVAVPPSPLSTRELSTFSVTMPWSCSSLLLSAQFDLAVMVAQWHHVRLETRETLAPSRPWASSGHVTSRSMSPNAYAPRC